MRPTRQHLARAMIWSHKARKQTKKRYFSNLFRKWAKVQFVFLSYLKIKTTLSCDQLASIWRELRLVAKKNFKRKSVAFRVYSKTSRSAKIFLGADNGSRTHLSGLGSPHTTDVLYPHISLILFFAQYFLLLFNTNYVMLKFCWHKILINSNEFSVLFITV